MVLVGGPNLDPDQSKLPEGVLANGYVPDLYRLMAACDIGICSGGSTTTLEFMVLQKPFLYFPLQRHFEQQIIVAGRNERLGAGRKSSSPGHSELIDEGRLGEHRDQSRTSQGWVPRSPEGRAGDSGIAMSQAGGS